MGIELTPQSKDGGKDIIAALKTELGRFLCLIETKHYHPGRPVQVGLVKQLYGTFIDQGANSAMLVTSSTFTRGAREFQSKHEYHLSLREYWDVVDWIQNYKSQQKGCFTNFFDQLSVRFLSQTKRSGVCKRKL